MPSISVVVPTYNRWAQLNRTLTALADQTVAQSEIEVIVVSDGSTDGTDERLRSGHPDRPITLISQANQGPAVARNTGVAAASGDLIVFIDDDVVPEPGCLAAHVRSHEQADGPTVVIGPLLTPDDPDLQPWVLWEQRMLEKQYEAMARGDWEPTARQFYTGNASLSRVSFEQSGGFDPSFLRGEDVELAYRLNDRGFCFLFDFEAKAYHHASRSCEGWLANASSYGHNDAVLWRDRGQGWLVPTIRAELEGRNPLTRLYTELGLRQPVIGRATPPLIAAATRVAGRVGLKGVAQAALSAVYNLAYYQGVVDELGGLDVFLAVEPQPNSAGSLQHESDRIDRNEGVPEHE